MSQTLMHAACRRLGLSVGKGMGAKATLFHAHVVRKMEEGDCIVRRSEPGFGGISSVEVALDKLESFSRSILDPEDAVTTWPMHLLLRTTPAPCDKNATRCLRQAIKRLGFRVVITMGTLRLMWSEVLSKAQREKQLRFRRPDLWQRAWDALREAERDGALYTRATGREHVPHGFLCPITLMVMHSPVVASDGHTYEEHAILQWLARRRTSPLTNRHLQDTQTYPNLALASCATKAGCTTFGTRGYLVTRQGAERLLAHADPITVQVDALISLAASYDPDLRCTGPFGA